MCRATIIRVLWLTQALVCFAHSARDDEEKENVHIEVRPRSFSQIHENEQMNATASTVQQTSSGMQAVGDESKNVRKQVEELEALSGLEHEAQPSASQVMQAKEKLAELALERKSVLEHADKLERQMHEQYAAMIGNEVGNVASLLSVSQKEDRSTLSEDEKFAELEKHTNQLTQWFSELKALRAERDAMIAHKEAASSVGATLGLKAEDMESQITALASKAKQQEAAARAAAQDKLAPALVSDEQRKQLANVMASSAIEMAQIKTASDDVLTALDALTDWKKRDDNSAESHEEAVKVQAKLSKAMTFLQEHEGIVNTRAKQINELMKDAGMGHL